MIRRGVFALAGLALAASPAPAQDKAKVAWVKPEVGLAQAAATGKLAAWFFTTGAESANGSRPSC